MDAIGNEDVSRAGPLRALLALQGAYFVATGLWPIVHYRSFAAVTGPKTDVWLVKTVGALIAVVGAVIGAASRRQEPPGEVVGLAAGSSAALGALDVIYAGKGRIAPIYLLDAVTEAVLIGALGVTASRARGL